MTIFEYIQQPEHPWIDTTKYTLPQIIMFFTGSVLWLVCYYNTLKDIRKKKCINIPVGCVITNYGWEISACIFFVPDMGLLLVISYWLWMILDTFIFLSTFKYGNKQMMIPFFKSNMHLFIIVGIIVSFATQATFMTSGFELPMAPISGDIINLYMSCAFLYLLFIPGYEGNSMVTAWSKFLGTGIINVMFFTKYPDNYFIVAIGLGCAIFDVTYIIMLHKKIKKTLQLT
jgi:hypothetical protein